MKGGHLGVAAAVEGGDGTGLEGDGGVGLFELGLALGEVRAELGEGVFRDVFGLRGVVLSVKHLGEVQHLLRDRFAP
ncbi:MAG: hypothetical protein GX565_04340 [Lentisphaerae bacterium]|nr:hypothetical protein [Lentisphaerota bacterium]